MLIENMKVGQDVWFEMCRMDEDGKKKQVAAYGRIQSIAKDEVILQGNEEQHKVHPMNCYISKSSLEFDMKWDRHMEDFMDKIAAAGEKYINGLSDAAIGVAKGYIKQKTSGQELFIKDAVLKTKIFAYSFRDKVKELTDTFVKKTQETGFEHLESQVKQVWLHTDLSQYEPGAVSKQKFEDVPFDNDSDIILEDSDLTGIPFTESAMVL